MKPVFCRMRPDLAEIGKCVPFWNDEHLLNAEQLEGAAVVYIDEFEGMTLAVLKTGEEAKLHSSDLEFYEKENLVTKETEK